MSARPIKSAYIRRCFATGNSEAGLCILPICIFNIGKNIVDETSGEGSREITFKTGHYITSYGYPVRCVKIQ